MVQTMNSNIGKEAWVTSVPASKVMVAARKKKAWHQKRVQHWLRQRKAQEKKFKAKGLKIVPNLFNVTSSGSSYTVASASNMKREIAQVDDKILRDWQNANAKAEQHKDLVRQYSKWMQFFAVGKVPAVLELTIEDTEFFGLVQE